MENLTWRAMSKSMSMNQQKKVGKKIWVRTNRKKKFNDLKNY